MKKLNKNTSKIQIHREYLAVGLILLAAFLIRVFDLERFPLHHDEANRIFAGADNFTYFLGVPVSCFKGYVWPFSSFFVAISRIYFTSLEYAVRIPSAVFGTLTIMLVYILCKTMYEKRTAFFSAIFLSFLPWHVYQARDGREMVYTSFFGSLLFLLLFASIKKKNQLFFLLFCFLLGIGSFYTYAASLTFIFVFLIITIALRKELSWLKRRTFLLSVLAVMLTFFPLVYLHQRGIITWATFRGYHKNPFTGPLFHNLWFNFQQNFPLAVKSLFFNSEGRMLYAASFHAPLLIHPLSILIILFVLFIMIKERQVQDKIILIWLFTAMVGSLSTMSFFLPEYIIAAQVPLIVLLSKGCLAFYNAASVMIGNKLSAISTYSLIALLIIISLIQLIDFYRLGPRDFEVCRKNSYGCKEAALFLSRLPEIENSNIYSDTRMTVNTYFHSFFKKDASGAQKNTSYYVVWAPESHPMDYWDGIFSYGFKKFKSEFPEQAPIYRIFYPSGLPAIYIFKVVK